HRAGHVVAVGRHWCNQSLITTVGRLHALGAFEQWPSEILGASARRNQIHFLPPGFADVADPHVAGRTIEAVAPRISESVRPDLAARTRAIDKWIGWWNRVWLGRIDVDAQDLAEQRAQILRLLGALVVTY